MRVAALDLGSNTFLLLIADVEGKTVKKVQRDLLTVTRLGQGVHARGLVGGRTDDREVEATGGADIAVGHFAEMQRKPVAQWRAAALAQFRIDLGHALQGFAGGMQRLAAGVLAAEHLVHGRTVGLDAVGHLGVALRDGLHRENGKQPIAAQTIFTTVVSSMRKTLRPIGSYSRRASDTTSGLG